MKRFAFIILWLILVVAFAAYGFFGPGFEGQIDGCPFFWDIAWSGALYYGGIGFSIATCIVGGLHVTFKVRRGALPKSFGILFVLLWSQVGAILPPVFMSISSLFEGETEMTVIFQTVLTVGMGILAFVAFTIAILCIRPVIPDKALQQPPLLKF